MTAIVEFLKTIPLAAWTAFIAFFGVWLTNWNNRKSLNLQLAHSEKIQQQRIARERLEELYVLVGRWASLITGDTIFIAHAAKGDYDYKGYLENVQKNQARNASFDFTRLEMILGVYGGRVQNSYQAALKARDALNVIKSKTKDDVQAKKPAKHYLDALIKADEAFHNAANDLKTEIVKATKEV